MLRFSPSVSFLLSFNIQFSAFSAPDILETSFSTTPNISFLGGDAPLRAHHWATNVRTSFCVFAPPLPEFLWLPYCPTAQGEGPGSSSHPALICSALKSSVLVENVVTLLPLPFFR